MTTPKHPFVLFEPGSKTIPPAPEDPMARLSPQQIDTYFEEGFLLLHDIFSNEEIQAMREAFERLKHTAEQLNHSTLHQGAQFVLEPLAPDEQTDSLKIRIHRVCWCGALEPVLLKASEKPEILTYVAQLLGCTQAEQLINQAHYKQPGDGLAFAWHQDSSHRRYGTPEWTDVNGLGSYVQVAIALDDVTADSGPLLFVPKSCKRGHLDLTEDTPLPFDEHDAVAALMKAGSIAMFGPFTFHRSPPNHTTAPRRMLINGYAVPGANSRVYPGDGAGRLLSLETTT